MPLLFIFHIICFYDKICKIIIILGGYGNGTY